MVLPWITFLIYYTMNTGYKNSILKVLPQAKYIAASKLTLEPYFYIFDSRKVQIGHLYTNNKQFIRKNQRIWNEKSLNMLSLIELE